MGITLTVYPPKSAIKTPSRYKDTQTIRAVSIAESREMLDGPAHRVIWIGSIPSRQQPSLFWSIRVQNSPKSRPQSGSQPEENRLPAPAYTYGVTDASFTWGNATRGSYVNRYNGCFDIPTGTSNFTRQSAGYIR